MARQAQVCCPGSVSTANNFGSTLVSHLDWSAAGHQGKRGFTYPQDTTSAVKSLGGCRHGSKAMGSRSLVVSLETLFSSVAVDTPLEKVATLLSCASFSCCVFRFLGLPMGNRAEYLHGSPIPEHRPHSGYSPSHFNFFCPGLSQYACAVRLCKPKGDLLH